LLPYDDTRAPQTATRACEKRKEPQPDRSRHGTGAGRPGEHATEMLLRNAPGYHLPVLGFADLQIRVTQPWVHRLLLSRMVLR
jgi:hypothetical protein